MSGELDITRKHYTDGEIESIERAAERRGREAARASERTIEPAGGEMPPVIPNQLSQVSHAGLALSVGDLLQRVAQLEQSVAELVPPERPTYVEHEPTAQGPTELPPDHLSQRPPVLEPDEHLCECEDGGSDLYVKDGNVWTCGACDYPVRIVSPDTRLEVPGDDDGGPDPYGKAAGY